MLPTLRRRLPLVAVTACLVTALANPVAVADPASAATTKSFHASEKTTPLYPKVAPYADPGLSSAPSSGKPGILYAARGLSSKIVEPIGGLGGILTVYAVFVVIHDLYELYLDRQIAVAQATHLPMPVDLWNKYRLPVPGQLSSAVSSAPQSSAAAAGAASSRLPVASGR